MDQHLSVCNKQAGRDHPSQLLAHEWCSQNPAGWLYNQSVVMRLCVPCFILGVKTCEMCQIVPPHAYSASGELEERESSNKFKPKEPNKFDMKTYQSIQLMEKMRKSRHRWISDQSKAKSLMTMMTAKTVNWLYPKHLRGGTSLHIC